MHQGTLTHSTCAQAHSQDARCTTPHYADTDHTTHNAAQKHTTHAHTQTQRAHAHAHTEVGHAELHRAGQRLRREPATGRRSGGRRLRSQATRRTLCGASVAAHARAPSARAPSVSREDAGSLSGTESGTEADCEEYAAEGCALRLAGARAESSGAAGSQRHTNSEVSDTETSSGSSSPGPPPPPRAPEGRLARRRTANVSRGIWW